MRWLLASLVLVTAACHKKDAGSCRTDAIQLPQVLAGIEHAPRELALGSTTLVERADLPPLVKVETPVVAVHGAVQVQHQEVAADGVGSLLAQGAPGTSNYLLAVDAQEPWSHVVAVVTAAKLAGFSQPHVLFTRPIRPDEAPPRTPIDGELDSIFAERRTRDLVAVAQRAVSRCPALQMAFGMSAGSDDPASAILGQLTPSLIDCDCNVDVPELRSILYRMYSSPRPVSTLRLVIDDGAPALDLPATTTWRDATRSLAGGPVAMRVTTP